MKVVSWISWDDAVKDKKEEVAVASMGGWFGFAVSGSWKTEPMRWRHYIKERSEAEIPYVEAIRESVLEHGLKVGGDSHQSKWVPLFEDGKVGMFSYRAWGDLMAAIWSEAENKDYTYMDFYMDFYMDSLSGNK